MGKWDAMYMKDFMWTEDEDKDFEGFANGWNTMTIIFC